MQSKRDFTDFEDFPGELNETTGMYEFPILKYTDVHGNTRKWQIFVRLVKDQQRQDTNDFNLLDEKQIDIEPVHFHSNSIPTGTIAEAYVETGVETGKIMRSAPTYFDKSVLINQANQRNCFQQALIHARSIYLKRKDKVSDRITDQAKPSKQHFGKFFPMLAKTYKLGAKHLVYPLYIQPKLNGVRCITYLSEPNRGYKRVVMYSRTQKDFPSLDYLKKLLYPYLNDLYDVENRQSIYLDGELYKHGAMLQDISGSVRNEKVKTEVNQYHIYDCFYPLELNNSFKSRNAQVQQIFSVMEANEDKQASELIKYVETQLIKNKPAGDKQYKQYLKLNYEGAMLRNINGPYAVSARSSDLVKMKSKFTDEYKIVNYTHGKGKDSTAVIWVAETADGHQFNVTPKDISYDERKSLYDQCVESFDTKFKNRKITVEYEELSQLGIPQRAKALVFRDYE